MRARTVRQFLRARRREYALSQSPLRDRSRQEILDAANLSITVPGRVLSQRHIQEAVCICRRKLLVSNETLRTAGFGPVPTRPARRRDPWGGRRGHLKAA